MEPIRNLAIEQKAVGTFGQKWGRNPDLNNPKERADVYKMAYPDGNLPAELAGTVDESLMGAGQATPTDPNSLEGLKGAKDEAYKGVEEMSQPNEAMRILQQAIKAKTGAKSKGIGESEIFKQAGVGGMGALSASLSARGQEMDINQAEFSNIVGKMAGNYRDQANMALERYNIKNEEYNFERDKLELLDQEARDEEKQIRLWEEKSRIDKDLASYKKGLSGITGDDEDAFIADFEAQSDSDGFVSPDDYATAKDYWINTLNKTPASFDSKFKGRRNPANPNYDVTGKEGDTAVEADDVEAITSYKEQNYSKEQLIEWGFDKATVESVYSNKEDKKSWWDSFWGINEEPMKNTSKTSGVR